MVIVLDAEGDDVVHQPGNVVVLQVVFPLQDDVSWLGEDADKVVLFMVHMPDPVELQLEKGLHRLQRPLFLASPVPLFRLLLATLKETEDKKIQQDNITR